MAILVGSVLARKEQGSESREGEGKLPEPEDDENSLARWALVLAFVVLVAMIAFILISSIRLS